VVQTRKVSRALAVLLDFAVSGTAKSLCMRRCSCVMINSFRHIFRCCASHQPRGIPDEVGPGAIPDAAGGEGGHRAAKPDAVIHRYRVNHMYGRSPVKRWQETTTRGAVFGTLPAALQHKAPSRFIHLTHPLHSQLCALPLPRSIS
jgi:hypothetical protein